MEGKRRLESEIENATMLSSYALFVHCTEVGAKVANARQVAEPSQAAPKVQSTFENDQARKKSGKAG